MSARNAISALEHIDAGDLLRGYQQLGQQYNLDIILIDTDGGLHDNALLSMAISDKLFLVLRPDRQDYSGSGVLLSMAEELHVPATIIVNGALVQYDFQEVEREVSQALGVDVACVIPYTPEFAELSGVGVFTMERPKHSTNNALKGLADIIQRELTG